MINFFLPGFYECLPTNMVLIKMWKQHPEFFREGINIKSCYGAFPNMVWNGGRAILASQVPTFVAKYIIEEYNRLGIGVRFTYTNLFIEDKHTYDTYCNQITEIANKETCNEALVSNKVLDEYLRKTYPNIKLSASVTNCMNDTEFKEYVDNNDDYEYVVLYMSYNTNEEFLKSIKRKDKVEILLNCGCGTDCSKRPGHYQETSRQQITYYDQDPRISKYTGCMMYNSNFYQALKRRDFIDIDTFLKYVDMGFCNFKLEGRDAFGTPEELFYVIESYVYYLIKPEYQNEVRQQLLIESYYNKGFEGIHRPLPDIPVQQ